MSSIDLCQICNKNSHKYVCPRCNIQYCSVPCYKSKVHIECSEIFYRECVVQELSQSERKVNGEQPVMSEDVKKMYSILKRMEKSDLDVSDNEEIEEEETIDSDDEFPAEDLEVRLSGINLNNADDVWEKLTSEEKLEFESLIRSGEVNQIVPSFKPWWEHKIEKKLIVEIVDKNNSDLEQNEIKYPEIVSDIKPFEKISIKQPAPCVYFNLSNLLASYTITVRFFDGDLHSYSKEATNLFIKICANMKSNKIFDSKIEAIQTVFEDCQLEDLTIDNTIESIEKDVNNIMNGPDDNKKCNTFILSALSDIYLLFTNVKDEEKITKENGNFSKKFKNYQIDEIKKSKLNIYIKKIEYYLSFVQKYG